MLRRSNFALSSSGREKHRWFSRSGPTPFINNHKRYANDIMYKGEGKTNSGWKQPFYIWSWKQRELFRNIQEAQFEHMRNVYKRQWYEGYRVNASEYIYKYNITKAAQLVQWENEMEAQEKKRREAYQRSAGRRALRDKHVDLLREYHEKEFFNWYERASERLQYMSQTMKFLDKNEIDQHIEAELAKYVYEPGRSYPLNFAGQMPLLEDNDGNIVAAGNHHYTRAVNEFPDLKRFDPPAMGEEETAALSRSISADLRSLDSIVSDDGSVASINNNTSGSSSANLDEDEMDVVSAQVVEQMAAEQQQAVEDSKEGLDEDKVTNLGDEDYERKRRMYIDRGRVGSKRGSVRVLKGGAKQADQLETISEANVGDVETANKKMKEAVAGEEMARRKKSKKAAIQQQEQAKQKHIDYAKSLLKDKDDELGDLVKKSVDQATVARDVDPESRTKGTIARPQKLIKPKLSQDLIDKLMKNTDGSGMMGGSGSSKGPKKQ